MLRNFRAHLNRRKGGRGIGGKLLGGLYGAWLAIHPLPLWLRLLCGSVGSFPVSYSRALAALFCPRAHAAVESSQLCSGSAELGLRPSFAIAPFQHV